MTEVSGSFYPGLIGKYYVPTYLPTQNGNSSYWQDLNSQKNDPNIWSDKFGDYKTLSTRLTKTIASGVTNYVIERDPFFTAGFYNRTALDAHLAPNDVSLPPEYYGIMNGVIDSYNNLLKAASVEGGHTINGDSIYLFGPISNQTITFKSGNHTIMSSPDMVNYVVTNQQIWAGDTLYPQARLKLVTEVFYPSAQGDFGTNNFIIENGNNLVYYDSSVASITAKGNGNNIFLPSKGSFNLAKNDFKINVSTTFGWPNQAIQVDSSSKTSLAPIPRSATANGYYSADNVYSLVSANEFDVMSGGGDIRLISNSKQTTGQTYIGRTASDRNATLNPDGTVNSKTVGNQGGQLIVAGSGNDIFYGIDPSFYPEFANNSNLTFISVPSENSSGLRFNEQNYHTTEMYGGGGNNIFYLGNPTKLAVNGNQFNGNYSYIIGAFHTAQTTQADKANLIYDVNNSSVGIINVNLATSEQSFTSSISSYTPDGGPSKSTLDHVRTGLGIAGSVLGARTAEGALSLLKFSEKIPMAGTAVAAASAVADTIAAIPGIIKFTNQPASPIEVSSKEVSQPLGNWKQAININDWNPNLIMQIQVNASSPAFQDKRWDQFEFSIEKARNTTSGEVGADIKFAKAGGSTQTLFHIDSLGADNSFGYYGWSFIQNKPIKITESNLDFFGELPLGISGINPLLNYKAKNGIVYSGSDSNTETVPLYKNGSYQFYFNDPAKAVADVKQSTNIISIKFDSSTLGWQWAPVFKTKFDTTQLQTVDYRDLTNFTTLDTQNSKLYVSDGGGSWKYYTYDQFNNITDALIHALEAQTYYSTTISGKVTVSQDQQATFNLISDLTLLKDYIPDLSKLTPTPTSSSPITLESIGQITTVKNATLGSTKGIDVYFHQYISGSNEAFKMFVHLDGAGNPVAASPEKITPLTIMAFEDQYNVDLNKNGIVGSPVVSILSTASDKNFVDALYQGIFNRTSDQQGRDFWNASLNNGSSRSEVLQNFLTSAEFLSKVDSYQSFVNSLYNDLLLRSPDDGGRDHWTTELEGGVSPKLVVNSFLSSSEFMKILGL